MATRNANRTKHTWVRPAIVTLLTSHNDFRTKCDNFISKYEVDRAQCFKVNGVLATPGVSKLCAMLEKAVPDIQFILTGRAQANSFATPIGSVPHTVAREFAGYFHGDPYPSVIVGETVEDFYVKSDTIQNNRYAAESEDFRKVFTQDIKKAVTLFKKYFRRVTPAYCANVSMSDYYSKVRNFANEMRTTVAEKSGEILSCGQYETFILAVATGTVDVTQYPAVLEAAKKYAEAVKQRDENAPSATHAMYVVPFQVGDALHYTVAYPTAKDSYLFKSDDELEAHAPGALGRIATLMMMEPGSYVNGVGMKVDDMQYWVVR